MGTIVRCARTDRGSGYGRGQRDGIWWVSRMTVGKSKADNVEFSDAEIGRLRCPIDPRRHAVFLRTVRPRGEVQAVNLTPLVSACQFGIKKKAAQSCAMHGARPPVRRRSIGALLWGVLEQVGSKVN